MWRNMLLKLGYTEKEVGEFIAGPAFLAWWEMNNLEGWGGPLPLLWYARQEKLQKQIMICILFCQAIVVWCLTMPRSA